MATTPILGLRYPTLSDAPNVPQDLSNLATDVESLWTTDIPYVRVTKTTGLPASVSTGPSWTKVQWSATEKTTVAGMWSSGAASRIVAPWAGDYTIKGVVGWSNSPGVTRCYTSVTKNGGVIRWRGNELIGNPAGGDTTTFDIDLTLAASDYVELELICVGGSGQLNNNDNVNLWAALEWKRS